MSSGLLGAIAGGALGYFTGGLGNVLTGASMGGAIGGAMDANQQTAASTAQQMAFQERMANSQYQRSVADLRAAGLNPILAASRGYTDPSPSGSSYVAQNEWAAGPAAINQTQQAMTAGMDYTIKGLQTGLLSNENTIRATDVGIRKDQARIVANEAKMSDASTALEMKYMRDHPTWWMLNRALGNAASTAVDVGRLGVSAVK